MALADEWPSSSPAHFERCENFSKVRDVTARCRATVVDMPMGLPADSVIRAADEQAWVRLKASSATTSSVFRTPPRSTLMARDKIEFQELHRKATGTGAGYPVWPILKLIRDVDSVLRGEPLLQSRIFEFHPEITWLSLSESVLHSKSSASGALQRLDVLNCRYPVWRPGEASSLRNRKVGLDDALDANAGLFVAQRIVDGSARTLPQSVPLRWTVVESAWQSGSETPTESP